MMPDLVAFLLSVSALTALVGNRIYRQQVPAGVAFPFVRIERSGGPTHHLSGTSTVRIDRLAITAYASPENGQGMAAADAALDAADIIAVRQDLRSVPAALTLAVATHRTIRVNLWWAFCYNIAALPLAAVGLLNPLIAGGAMAASSLFVVANSMRLRSSSDTWDELVATARV